MTKKIKKTTAFLSAVAMVMAMLLYFPSGMFSNIDWGLKASAEGETQTENWIDFAATEFAGGTGTEGDPYQIATADQLAYLAKQVNAGTNYSGVFFKLTADIDLGGKEWTPIGTSSSSFSFKGKFSGDGHKIKNLTINSESDNIGLFGFNGGTIMNVGIESGSVKGGAYVGGVCSYNEGGTISNCYNTGSVTGESSVGGVCGYNEGGSISNCYNTGSVTGTGPAVGGVCGSNCADSDGTATISNCYNTGNVSGSNWVGGVCGYNQVGTITNCYNTGSVTGNTNVGGVCGENFNANSSNCYYLKGTAEKGIGNDSDTAGSKTLNELCVLDFGDTNVWTAGSAPTEITTIAEGSRFGKKVYTLPSLNGVGTALTTELNYYNFSTTETADWQEYTPITDAAGLQAINNNLSGNYVLMNDIDLSTVADFTPIGNAFKGKFSGDGHKIKNLTINSESDYIGLFGFSEGTIMNVGIEGGSVTGICFVGGVCGYNKGGTISNCYNTGSVTGGEYVGGVCGENYQGTISNCYNTGDIIGKAKTSSSFESALPGSGESNHVGGVCGDNDQGTITNCYNTGEVTGEEYVGGVCGLNFQGTISNCYYLAGKATGGINGSDEDGSAKEIAYTTLCDDTKLPTGFESSVWANGQITGYNPIEEGSRFGTEAFVFPSLIDVGTAQTISKGTDKLFYNFGTTETADWQEYISISTAEELQAIGNDSTSLGKNYVLKEDIDLKAITNFTPIGTDETKAFTGKFSGNGHKITNLTINSESNNVGLFGYSNGTIMNVGIEGGSVTGKVSVGGVCGYNKGGTISNCYNTAIVKGTGDFVGGVCGYNFEGTITDCNNTGSVTGGGYVGGVCGYNCGTISNCYNTGSVTGKADQVGGVCGYNDFDGTISNCYFDSKVYNGNAVGYNYGTVSGNVLGKTTKQFTSGEVAYLLSQGCTVGSTQYKGDVWGQDLSVKNSYPVLGGKKVYLTTGECVYYTNTFYAEGQSHSYKNGICDNCGGYDPAKQNSNGEYEISNAGQLYWFAALVNKGGDNLSAHAVLTADITVNTGNVAGCNGTKATGWIDWTPIGNHSNQFSGTFDGQNHTISGLYFNNPDTSYVGLFGYSKGTIKNVGVVDSYFKGKIYVGGVCGDNNGTITNCYNTGNVSGSENVGGVCGTNEMDKITNCYNTGNVSGTGYYVGGVCGWNNVGIVTNCYNTGNVSGTNYVGGVCGCNGGGTIANCYFDSKVYNGNAVSNNYGTVSKNVLGKETKQFTSGEVAYLLSQGCTVGSTQYKGDVWGQTLTGDNKQDYPVLGGKKVLTDKGKTKYVNDIIIYGQNAVLDGTIGFNIYVAADDNYKWSAKIDGKEVPKPEKDENGIYKFTCNVAAKDMAKDIEFYINENVKATVSVKKYLDNLNKSGNTPLTELVTAMETYGTAADKFFNGGNVDPVDSVTAENLSDYEFTKNDAPEGISYYGSSLLLKSETTVRHYFKLEDGKKIGNFTFKVNDSVVTPVKKSGYYYIDIENISADKLGTAHTVKIGDVEVISNYSALSYAETVLSKPTADENLKNLVKTLYLYNQKAKTYSTTGGGN